MKQPSQCQVQNLESECDARANPPSPPKWGSDQMIGSRYNFQRFTNKRVPAGMWKPATMQSSVASRGGLSGLAGYNRNVSLTMACNTSQLLSSKETSHVSVTIAVSDPPKRRLCKKQSNVYNDSDVYEVMSIGPFLVVFVQQSPTNKIDGPVARAT
ncbi:hypothetical protein AgCh_016569 [Apium graveolens]